MKHYKNALNETFGFDDGATIPDGLIEITIEEARELNTARQPKPDAETIRILRQSAYANESDPLFFKWQRGEATEQEWLAKVSEIKSRYVVEQGGE